MRARSYAVVWSENGSPVYAGKLELASTHLRLEGAAPRGGLSLQKLFYDELSAVRVARRPAERIDGRPALVLERRDASTLRIGSVDGRGALLELAERLTDITRR